MKIIYYIHWCVIFYSAEHAFHYPLPWWLFDQTMYVDWFMENLFIKDPSYLKKWMDLDEQTKMKIINGDYELRKSYHFVGWPLLYIDRNPKFKPFFTDLGYDYDFKKRYLSPQNDIDTTFFKDIFSPSGDSIRYSFQYREDNICFISNGPDGDMDIDEKKIFFYDLFGKYNPPSPDNIYDPTNGLKSNGDIYYFYHFGDPRNFELIPAFRDIKIHYKSEMEMTWENWKNDMMEKVKKNRDKIF